ncbi:hypothetical protein A3A21_03750 [Candidatus Jorgensenbacteria bacterium RIFCSPLOWO2_01_FULL_45_25b]|uniref:Aspartyl/glutamyl-tRNA(Asn/Gln) amidotransferase subunit C n=1 Tax=Candidatus Jorgensenbacteria bacterium RIFCSPLOWO2_01_FULL_45_25b TaxID=1798471 RepID=A0A1F6BXL9_9BACT|nr:MAG: hypothetical protein A3A21_03750 [Candidatus Jorgensenbacteria bacterium RIFCSPLOWO2_01_FULL_45_25b]
MIIDKKEVGKLADLARIQMEDGEKEALREDLERILDYFSELKEVDTDGIEPMTGGVFHENTHRHDDEYLETGAEREDLIRAFPEGERDFLKIPPVFE